MKNRLSGSLQNKLGISNLDDVALIDKGIVIKSDMLVAATDVPSGMKPGRLHEKVSSHA